MGKVFWHFAKPKAPRPTRIGRGACRLSAGLPRRGGAPIAAVEQPEAAQGLVVGGAGGRQQAVGGLAGQVWAGRHVVGSLQDEERAPSRAEQVPGPDSVELDEEAVHSRSLS